MEAKTGGTRGKHVDSVAWPRTSETGSNGQEQKQTQGVRRAGKVLGEAGQATLEAWK